MALSPQFIAALQNMPKPGSGLQGSDTQALAHMLLTEGVGDFSSGVKGKAAGHQGQSALNRFLDILSRPLYAAANAAYESEDASANHRGLLKELEGLGTGVVHGFSGTQKRTFADVLQQGKDINAHRKATGTSAGYQLGEGGNLGLGEKLGAIGLNIVGDPSLTLNPSKVVRAFGEGSELYKLPTIASLSKRAFTKMSPAAEAVAAANNEAGALPANVLLNINPKGLAKAKSIPDILRAKIGDPVAIPQPVHPHVEFNPEAIKNGELKPTKLTPAGAKAASDLYKERLKIFNDAAPAAIAKATSTEEKIPRYKALQDYLKQAPLPEESAKDIAQMATKTTGDTMRQAVARNRQWVSEAIKNGIDPQRALEVLRGFHAGEDLNTVLRDAIDNSKLFKGTKILKASDLANPKLIKPAFKLSSILAPTPGEVLDAVHPGNPNAALASQTIEAARHINAIKRTAALAQNLSSDDAAIRDYAVEKAIDAIHGRKGRKVAFGALNDIVQSHMWDNIRNRVVPLTRDGAANVREINGRTFRIAAHAEAELERLGYKAVSGDGSPARLTDAIANASGYPNKLGTYVNHIINNYAKSSLVGAADKAAEAIKEATTVEPIVKNAALQVNQIFADPNLSDPVKFLGKQKTAKDVERAILMSTGSSTAARAGKALYKGIIDSHTSAPQQSIIIAGKALSDIVSTGAIPSNYNHIVSELGRSLSEAFSEGGMPLPAPKVLGTLIGPHAAAEVGVLGRLATWYGQHDVRDAVVRGLNTARTNASDWAKLYHDTFDGLTAEQRVEALRTAQTIFEGVNPDVIAGSEKIRSRMENLFSSSGLTEAARRANSVAMRGGVTMKEINAELKRVGSDFQFTNGKKVPHPFGFDQTRDFSNGTDWLNSWEAHKFVGNPAQNLARIETAVWNVMGKKAIIQDIADRFGTTVADAEKYVGIKNFDQLKGVYFHPEIAQQITRVIRDLYAPKPQNGQMIRMIDNIMRMWKTQATIYSPSHSIRNMIGDIYNSWIAGVNSPRVYLKAIQVMRSTADEYKNLENLVPFLNQEKVPERIAQLGRVPGKRIIVTTKDGQKLTADQIKMAARNEGLLMSAGDIEDINFGKIPHIQPFGGKVHDFAHGVVESADHFTRLAHFIDRLSKSSGDLPNAFREAGKEVRKYHPDGMDLTDFERNVLRRVIPFYSWTRKAIPFTIEGILAKPGKFMAYPKVTATLNYQPGEGINPGQQFPTDQLFPSWITDAAMGPLGRPGGILNDITGGPAGYVTGGPMPPPIDIFNSYINHPAQGLLSGLTPIIKSPIELMEGHRLDTQAPITNRADYVAQQVPILGLLERLTNIGLTGPNKKGQSNGIGNQQAFVNFLTGLNLTDTGNFIKQAQYERHLKQVAAKKRQAQLMKQMFGG